MAESISKLTLTSALKSPSHKLHWIGKLSRQILFYVALLILWQVLVTTHIWQDYQLPGPLSVLNSLSTGIQNGTIWVATLTSLRRLAIGYLLSVLIGLMLGVLIGVNTYVEETLGSLILGLQALPSVCWIPLAILWYGLGESAMTFVVVMGAVFSITLGVQAGVKNTPPVYIKAAKNMGARGPALLLQVIIPAALPSIIVGLKQGWTFAWRSLMAAELIYVTLSLGGLLEDGQNYQDTAQVFAIMLVIIVICMVIDGIFFSPLEKRIRQQWGLNR